MSDNRHDPHADQPVHAAGVDLEHAESVLILLHGRGAAAESMIPLVEALAIPRMAALLPEAYGRKWYPERFIAPIARNQPYLSSALNLIDSIVTRATDAGLPTQRIILGGFSQGACLAGEYAARNPLRYGGVLMFSGGLIGPPGALPAYEGDLAGTPVFLGCSDSDFHIPKERVEESAEVFRDLGATVDAQLYAGMGHTINEDELDRARRVTASVQP